RPNIYPLSLHDALPIYVERGISFGNIHITEDRPFVFGGNDADILVPQKAGLFDQETRIFINLVLIEDRQKNADVGPLRPQIDLRSEEHTSELQSRGHLV